MLLLFYSDNLKYWADSIVVPQKQLTGIELCLLFYRYWHDVVNVLLRQLTDIELTFLLFYRDNILVLTWCCCCSTVTTYRYWADVDLQWQLWGMQADVVVLEWQITGIELMLFYNDNLQVLSLWCCFIVTTYRYWADVVLQWQLTDIELMLLLFLSDNLREWSWCCCCAAVTPSGPTDSRSPRGCDTGCCGRGSVESAGDRCNPSSGDILWCHCYWNSQNKHHQCCTFALVIVFNYNYT